MRAMVVAVMQRLDQDHAGLAPVAALVKTLYPVIRLCSLDDLEQLGVALCEKLAKPLDTRERFLLCSLRRSAAEPFDIPLLGADKVLDGVCDGSVGPRCGQLELLVAQRRDSIEQLPIRPRVVAVRLQNGRPQNPSILLLVGCQGMRLDSLTTRNRILSLFERYGALLTGHQRDVLDLYLRSDWSLAEIAAHGGTSRAAVHDIVRRSTRSLEEYEQRLGLLAEAGRRKRKIASLERELADFKRRVAQLGTS